MSTLKAVVKNGCLVLNEPTELPEGTVIELRPVSPNLTELQRQVESGGDLLVEEVDPDNPNADPKIVNLVDEMDPDELEHFRAHLKVSLAQAEAGETIPADEVLERLRNLK